VKKAKNSISFVFGTAEGYVKALEKSTSPVLSWREVFEPCVQTGLARDLSCGRKTVV
jgi:hypothetical protein